MRKLALRDEILLSIEKPARYIGNEVNAVMKSRDVDIRFAMCFPDVYEIGMSHLGIQILYDMFNKREDTCLFPMDRSGCRDAQGTHSAVCPGVPGSDQGF